VYATGRTTTHDGEGESPEKKLTKNSLLGEGDGMEVELRIAFVFMFPFHPCPRT